MLKVGDTIYVMRYALTTGIVKLQIPERGLMDDGRVYAAGWIFSEIHRDPRRRFCVTEEEALKLAEQMRADKIARLKKQAEKLAKKQLRIMEIPREMQVR